MKLKNKKETIDLVMFSIFLVFTGVILGTLLTLLSVKTLA